MKNLFLLIFIFSALIATAQSKLIAGKITNNKGAPVPYATVKIKGTNKAVAADAGGAFNIHKGG
ncbi:MAG: hypothetical protein ACR2FN_12600 [Chitinophagaceae bacterium]